MDQTSVEEALNFEPEIGYRAVWEDDSDLTVVLQEATRPGTTYTLTIERVAADSDGLTMIEAFTISFNGTGSTGDPRDLNNLWLQVSVLMAAAWVAVLALLLWSRRGVKHLRTNIRQLALQVERLSDSAPSDEIKGYHR